MIEINDNITEDPHALIQLLRVANNQQSFKWKQLVCKATCKPYLTDEQISQVSPDCYNCYISEEDTTSYLYNPTVGFSFFPEHDLQCLDHSLEMEIVLKDRSSIEVTLSIQTINTEFVKKRREEKQALLKNASQEYQDGSRYVVM